MQVELAVCERYGVRHSEFLGWDQDDRDKAIWWHIRHQTACPSCETRAEEWDETRGGDLNAYVADLARCRGCEQVQAMRESLTGEEGRGVHVVLKPRRGVSGGGNPGP